MCELMKKKYPSTEMYVGEQTYLLDSGLELLHVPFISLEQYLFMPTENLIPKLKTQRKIAECFTQSSYPKKKYLHSNLLLEDKTLNICGHT